jgi:hypothetical protein
MALDEEDWAYGISYNGSWKNKLKKKILQAFYWIKIVGGEKQMVMHYTYYKDLEKVRWDKFGSRCYHY